MGNAKEKKRTKKSEKGSQEREGLGTGPGGRTDAGKRRQRTAPAQPGLCCPLPAPPRRSSFGSGARAREAGHDPTGALPAAPPSCRGLCPPNVWPLTKATQT